MGHVLGPLLLSQYSFVKELFVELKVTVLMSNIIRRILVE